MGVRKKGGRDRMQLMYWFQKMVNPPQIIIKHPNRQLRPFRGISFHPHSFSYFILIYPPPFAHLGQLHPDNRATAHRSASVDVNIVPYVEHSFHSTLIILFKLRKSMVVLYLTLSRSFYFNMNLLFKKLLCGFTKTNVRVSSLIHLCRRVV